MSLICKGIFLLGALLSVAHTGDYAYYLWCNDRRRQAAIIGCWCGIVTVMAIRLVWNYE